MNHNIDQEKLEKLESLADKALSSYLNMASFEKYIRNEALTAKEEQDLLYYFQLTDPETGYNLNQSNLTDIAISHYVHNNRIENNAYPTIEDFAKAKFPDVDYPNEPQINEDRYMFRYMQYLVAPNFYSITTGTACEDTDGLGIMKMLMGIYRHANIQIHDSLSTNLLLRDEKGKVKKEKKAKKGKDVEIQRKDLQSHRGPEILELNLAVQTNELALKKGYSQVVEAPGIVTMALHIAGQELLASGEYNNLLWYRPWENDCHTYVLHAQQRMNELLPKQLQQDIISHYRYSPHFNSREIKKIKQQIGIDSPEILVTGKGPNYVGIDYNLADNFRNKDISREKGEKLSSAWKYYPWVLKRFARSTVDRFKRRSLSARLARKIKNYFKSDIAIVLDKAEKADKISNTLIVNVVNFSESIKASDLPNKETILQDLNKIANDIDVHTKELINKIKAIALFMSENHRYKDQMPLENKLFLLNQALVQIGNQLSKPIEHLNQLLEENKEVRLVNNGINNETMQAVHRSAFHDYAALIEMITSKASTMCTDEHAEKLSQDNLMKKSFLFSGYSSVSPKIDQNPQKTSSKHSPKT